MENNKPKVHYAECDQGTESDPQDYWSDTACGMEYTESPLTNRKEQVTCKKCLNKINAITPPKHGKPNRKKHKGVNEAVVKG